MSSESAQRLTAALAGRYRIERELGAGGMATVYLAHDLKHDRDVAIKVLHPDLGAALGGERFLSEIKTTAKLQHPHILPLLDSGEADGLLFYVMPVVTGETLRARLTRERQLPISEAVRLAREVAGALDYAHRHGVVHRDIKPENILLHDGQALVADFGIALAVQSAGGQRMTQTGLSLGTPQYMSPEQAMGEKTIDARSDVYALGAVTYEMLTGDPPFAGSSVQAIVARVLTEKPTALTTLRDTVPPGLEAAVLQSLAKLPADRFASAAEFASALGSSTTSGARDATAARTAPSNRERQRAWFVVVVTLIAFAATGGWLAGRLTGTASGAAGDAPVNRLEFSATGQSFAYPMAGVVGVLALSPDGSNAVVSIARPNGFMLAVRRLDALSAQPLPGTEGALSPAFSPDGRWIAFAAADGNLKKIAVDGTSLTTITGGGGGDLGGVGWLSNKEIVFAPRSMIGAGIFRVPAEGGVPRPFTRPDSASGEVYQQNPVLTDEGRLLLYSSIRATASDLSIGVVDVASGKVKPLPLAGAAPLGLIDGVLIYVRSDGALMAAKFDTKTLTASTPVQVGDSIAVRGVWYVGAALSATGTLLYQQGGSTGALVRVDLAGNEKALLDSARAYVHPRFSPNGQRLAVEVGGTASADIWTVDIAGRSLERVTNAAINDRPEWSPDGRRVLFTSSRDGKTGIWWQPIDGSGPAEQLLAAAADPVREGVITPDGRTLIYRVDARATKRDIWMRPLDAKQPSTPLLQTASDEKQPRVSPDGRWMLYMSDESGREEVYVRSLQPNGGRAMVSVNGGSEPLWAPDGRHAYYRSTDQVWEATLSLAAAPQITARRVLFRGAYATDQFHANYDIAPDGRSFVMIRPVGENRRTLIVVNWCRELRQRMGLDK